MLGRGLSAGSAEPQNFAKTLQKKILTDAHLEALEDVFCAGTEDSPKTQRGISDQIR
jgi:hypothetical protein